MAVPLTFANPSTRPGDAERKAHITFPLIINPVSRYGKSPSLRTNPRFVPEINEVDVRVRFFDCARVNGKSQGENGLSNEEWAEFVPCCTEIIKVIIGFYQNNNGLARINRTFAGQGQ
ncbi:hypothetical protein [Kluyvera georgiana]|uniref:hypothetical protein n=1 Tax=Kluyvera georgiana TaxID=73098 RepID=UPI001ADF6388|nr:hypothetical protein [Kluyvera georgiana]